MQENLLAILSAKLDEKDPLFKETAIQLVEEINSRDKVYYNKATPLLLEILDRQDNILGVPFAPKKIDELRAQRDFALKKVANMSSLYRSSNILRSLKGLGYSDMEYRAVLEGGVIPTFYSKEHNVAVIGLDSTNLVYNRINPNGKYTILKRALETHPLKPKVYTVNILLFNQATVEAERTEE